MALVVPEDAEALVGALLDDGMSLDDAVDEAVVALVGGLVGDEWSVSGGRLAKRSIFSAVFPNLRWPFSVLANSPSIRFLQVSV